MIAIVVWTCLTVFFLGSSSKYYIVTSCVCSSVVCYFDSRSAYFNVCDNRSIWCDCCYREWISIGPFTKYFLTVLITCPSVAVCIVHTLIYIFECSRSLYLILTDRCIIFVCDAITVCRNYIIITCSAVSFTRKDNSCFVTNNFNIADYWSTNIFRFLYRYFLASCIALAISFSCYSSSSITIVFYIVFCCWNDYATIKYSSC